MTNTVRRTVLAAMALGGIALAAPQAVQAGNRNFTFVNNLPWTATTVQVRPAGSVDWGRDLLGTAVVPSGQQLPILVGEGPQCLFDIQVGVAGAGGPDQMVFRQVELCKLTTMTVYWNGQYQSTFTSLR